MAIILSGDALRVISELASEPLSALPAAPVERPRPFWHAEPCPAWCTAVHEDSDQQEDRNHWADAVDVELNLYRAEYGNGEYGPAHAIVGMTQGYRDAEVDLTVPRTDTSSPYLATGEQGVRMSVAETRALRDRLSQLLAMADGRTAAEPEVDLTSCGDHVTRRSAECAVQLGGEFWSGETITTNLLQWTQHDTTPELEVEVMTGGNSYGATPAQARTIAQQLRAAAENIDALADHAEQANARIGGRA